MNARVEAAIRQRAAELGFDLCRFTTAAPPASRGQFREWLAARSHGDMTYLARQADKRSDLQLVLPGARSVIGLAVSYHLDSTPSGPRPLSSVLRPPSSDIRPLASGLRPLASGLRPLASGLRPPASALWHPVKSPAMPGSPTTTMC